MESLNYEQGTSVIAMIWMVKNDGLSDSHHQFCSFGMKKTLIKESVSFKNLLWLSSVFLEDFECLSA